jgi:hypothetical protein
MVDPLATPYTESVGYDLGTLGGQFGDGDAKHAAPWAWQGYDVAANGDAHAQFAGPPGPLEGIEDGLVEADFQGPFSNPLAGPTQTGQVVIAVSHSNMDKVFNSFGSPVSFAQTTAYAQTYSSGGYALMIQNNGFGALLEIHFHAHFDNTQAAPFQADPHLSLGVGNLVNFSVGPDYGYVAAADDGTVLDQDVTFGATTDPGHDVDFDLPGVPVSDGSLDVNYMSALQSYVTDGFMPDGVTQNNSHFTWSLTLTLT